jgi:hypothetical protein
MAERNTKTLRVLAVLVVLAALAGITTWYKFYRVVPQPAWIRADQRDAFLYGSVDPDQVSGVPYWIWLALPRMFPEYMPAPGGYAALGLSWEEGREMPVGFAKQRIGYIRVTGNCALCHATSQRSGPDAVPTVIPVATGHTTDIQPLLTFFKRCAQDQRFNADEILGEVETATTLSLADRTLYRFVLVPRTRRALLNPSEVLLAPALLQHRDNPQTDAPFSEPQMKEMQERMKALQMVAKP